MRVQIIGILITEDALYKGVLPLGWVKKEGLKKEV